MTLEEMTQINDEVMQLCSESLKDDKLVNEFCWLRNINRPDKLSPSERQIDKACGYDAGMKFMRLFTDFVREFIYISRIRLEEEDESYYWSRYIG